MDKPNDTSPDDLMNHFRGRSLKSIVIFTLIVHAVVIFATSVPFLLRKFGAADTAKLSDQERKELAVKEATTKLREIAEQYGMQPQQLSDQLSGRKAPAQSSPDTDTTAEPTTEPPTTPEEPKSDIEKQLEKTEPGPELPPVDQADDLFK